MKIGDVMNTKPVKINESAKLKDAAGLVSETQTSDLMVVDTNDNFKGVISEGDLIRATLPEYDDLMKDGTPLGQAWKIFIEKGKELADHPIDKVVIGSPVTFQSTDELLKAAATMINKQIRILPVVDNDKLVGTISRGDLAAAVVCG